MMKKISQNNGVSIVETVIYIAIFVSMIGLLISYVLVIPQMALQLKVTRDSARSATISMERITREIQGATAIDDAESIFGAHPGKLVLTVPMDGGGSTTTEIYLDGSTLKIIDEGRSAQPLILSNTSVNSFIVSKITTANALGVKIELELETVIKNATSTIELFDSAVLRGTYTN